MCQTPTILMSKTKPKTNDLADWRAETLDRVRTLIVEADPDVIEERKWRKPSNRMVGVPVWSHDGIICTGETYKQVVKLTFARGASLPDPSRRAAPRCSCRISTRRSSSRCPASRQGYSNRDRDRRARSLRLRPMHKTRMPARPCFALARRDQAGQVRAGEDQLAAGVEPELAGAFRSRACSMPMRARLRLVRRLPLRGVTSHSCRMRTFQIARFAIRGASV